MTSNRRRAGDRNPGVYKVSNAKKQSDKCPVAALPWARPVRLPSPISSWGIGRGRFFDLLIIWQGPDDALHNFMQELNNNVYNIKLTYQTSKTEVDFLDIKIEVDENLYLQTDVFRKSTAVNSLLHANSGHPYSTIRAIPVGQHLRMKRICSSTAKFEAQASDLRVRFQARGYSNRSIRQGYLRARHAPRDELLCSNGRNQKRKEQQDVIRYITTYNSEWSTMRGCLQKHWDILRSDPTLSKCLTNYPAMTARKSKNLRDLLVSSHYAPKKTKYDFGSGGPPKGCFPCRNCITCPNICRTTTFDSVDGSRTYTINHHINCNTTQVVYYAVCGCPKIYVGLTSRRLGTRIREHVRDIMAAKTVTDMSLLKTIPRHFRQFHGCSPKTFQARGIDHVLCGIRGGDVKRILAQRECRWITLLGTMAPMGLNETQGFSSFL
ncbi:unnamed protein product [Ranitomeya imitator]|uniref:Helix-turn-helix domain-containing protein n=1 Tax=Ranitomeya imitator TaxID=111125 RepID=A0ABN9L972_9NEOB|nr:unnamed protein product [Ranitomeya imitator]